MKKMILWMLIAVTCLYAKPLFAAGENTDSAKKAKLNSMLKDIMEKSKNTKPVKYEVTVPVATAGARGARTKQIDKFAVIWPDTGISPITALAENMRYASERGEKTEALKAQFDEFNKVFPEYAYDPLLKELSKIIQQH